MARFLRNNHSTQQPVHASRAFAGVLSLLEVHDRADSQGWGGARMCGIVGLYLKDATLQDRLGRWLAAMLAEMAGRGPDSTGVAVYGTPTTADATKLTLRHSDAAHPWNQLLHDLTDELGISAAGEQHADHFVLRTDGSAHAVRQWLAHHHPAVSVVGVGHAIEIYKSIGRPQDVAARFHLAERSGSMPSATPAWQRKVR